MGAAPKPGQLKFTTKASVPPVPTIPTLKSPENIKARRPPSTQAYTKISWPAHIKKGFTSLDVSEGATLYMYKYTNSKALAFLYFLLSPSLLPRIHRHIVIAPGDEAPPAHLVNKLSGNISALYCSPSAINNISEDSRDRKSVFTILWKKIRSTGSLRRFFINIQVG